jgi:hypothetical protein
MTPHLIGIPSADVDAVWPLAAPLIDAACRRGRDKETAEDIRRALGDRALQLWLAWDGAVVAVAVTEIVCHPRKRCCRIRICTGRARAGWQHYLAVIEAWARAQGCAAMELIARPGWSRHLARHGYATTHLFCEKEL